MSRDLDRRDRPCEPEGGPPSFDEILVEQLKRAPWFVCSLVFHALVFLVISTLLVDAPPSEANAVVRADVVDRPHEEFEDVDPEVDEPDPEELPEPDVTLTESPETPDEFPDDAAMPDDESLADSPFELKATSPLIGGPGGAGSFFGDRRGGPRRKGGGERAERAVTWGLDWLARHQSEDGSWDSDGFQARCRGNVCEGKGHPLYDAGLSGIALLAFLGAGHTHVRGEYRDTVRNGLRYLTTIQDPEGCFGIRSAPNFTYGHAICTLAMTEAYGLTRFPLFERPAERGLDFIERCRNPYSAWRYGVAPGDDDTSVTGWMVMALKSAEGAGLKVDPTALSGARAFFDSVTDENGRVGYTRRGNGPVRIEGKDAEFPAEHSEALTAVGVVSRVFLKEDPATSEKIQLGADLLARCLPAWEPEKLEFYYWYYGTLAMHQVGGPRFDRWNKAMQAAVIETQVKDGDAKGSWPPADAWGEEGGRVYSTALLTLCLEVYYRYPRVFGG